MNGTNKAVLIACIALQFLNCGDKLPAKEYMQYFERNHSRFTKTVERNDVILNVSYIPGDFLAAREIAAGVNESVENALRKYSNTILITVGLSSRKGGTVSVLLRENGNGGFSENVYRNDFERNRDIFLLCGADTVKAASYDYERNWGMGSQDVFAISFPRSEIRKPLSETHLMIRDLLPELGSVDIALGDIVKKSKLLKR
jgi:hypothetical protein